MIIIFVFSLLYDVSLAIITHDTDQFVGFDYGTTSGADFACKSGFTKTSTITFSDQFANPPQIILSVESVDQPNTSPQVILNILSITTSSFQLYINCPSVDQLYRYRFRWFAIDDQRIQVINQFNIVSFTNYTIPHSNPNAVAGFISLLGVGYSGPLNFQINIKSINTTHVSIDITNPNNKLTNIKQLNFQIILAVPEAINLISTKNVTANFASSNIPVISNTFFIVATNGYIYSRSDNIRHNVTYSTNNPIKYNYNCWEGTYVQNTHSQIQLYYTYTQYTSMKCNHARIGTTNDPFQTSFIPFGIQMLEFNSNFAAGTYSFILDKTISTINLITSLSCQAGKKVQSSFFMYPGNTGSYQIKTQFHFCGGPNKIITYYVRFIQQMVANQEFKIVITDTSCQFMQVLYNQLITTSTLMSLTIINA